MVAPALNLQVAPGRGYPFQYFRSQGGAPFPLCVESVPLWYSMTTAPSTNSLRTALFSIKELSKFALLDV